MKNTPRASLPHTVRELVDSVQRDDAYATDSLDMLLESHTMLIRASAARGRDTAGFDDCLQEARIAFVAAARHFNSSAGATFATYAFACMRNAVAKHLDRERRWSERVSRFDQSVEELGAEFLFPFEEQLNVRDAVARLPQRDKMLLFRLYWRDQAQDAVARTLRISQQAISKQQRSALHHLRASFAA